MTESKAGGQKSLLEQRLDNTRLARDCAKLHSAEEQAFAEEGIAGEAALWPEMSGELVVGPGNGKRNQ